MQNIKSAFIILLLQAVALAPQLTQGAEPSLTQDWKNMRSREQNFAQTLNGCERCYEPTLSRCRRHQAEMFNKPTINITVGIGYQDFEDKLGNWSDESHDDLVQKLTRACEDGKGMDRICGFERSKADPTLFTKKMKFAKDDEKTIAIRVFKGSLPPKAEPAEQRRHCAWARKTFLEAVANPNTDMVLYDGHSRDGGGPDFCPAERKNGRIDYPKYRKERPGFKDLVTALQARQGKPLPVLGVLSCSSQRHFQDELLRTSPDTSLILTNDKLKKSQTIPTVTTSIAGILRKICGVNLERSGEGLGMEFVNFR